MCPTPANWGTCALPLVTAALFQDQGMFHASGHPSSCRDFHAHPCWCLRLHYCSSCVASEENYNCLERQETRCAWPTSSHTCAHIRWQPDLLLLVFYTETRDTHREATSESHALPACSQHQGHTTAAQPKVTLCFGGSGYIGQTPHRLQWHLLMANLGVGKAVTQTTNEYKPHCQAPLTKALGKEKQEERKLVFCLRTFFLLKRRLRRVLVWPWTEEDVRKKN